MKREMDLIRELLLKLERLPTDARHTRLITRGDVCVAIDGYSDDQIAYHLTLLSEHKLIDCPGSQHSQMPQGGRRRVQWAPWRLQRGRRSRLPGALGEPARRKTPQGPVGNAKHRRGSPGILEISSERRPCQQASAAHNPGRL